MTGGSAALARSDRVAGNLSDSLLVLLAQLVELVRVFALSGLFLFASLADLGQNEAETTEDD